MMQKIDVWEKCQNPNFDGHGLKPIFLPEKIPDLQMEVVIQKGKGQCTADKNTYLSIRCANSGLCFNFLISVNSSSMSIIQIFTPGPASKQEINKNSFLINRYLFSTVHTKHPNTGCGQNLGPGPWATLWATLF